MRVFVSVDMEGTSGLERLEGIFRGRPDLAEIVGDHPETEIETRAAR